MRRLEARIGELIPRAEGFRVRDRDPNRSEFDSHQRFDFRQMAANPDVVEPVIAVAVSQTARVVFESAECSRPV